MYIITISVVFLLFLILFYFLGIIKLSAPLILIYLVFFFSHFISNDISKEYSASDKNNNEYKNNDSLYVLADKNKSIINNLDNKEIIKDIQKKSEISKPIVSFNPKPIVIDSNLIIQKSIDNSKLNKITTKTDEALITQENSVANVLKLKLKEIMICRGVYKRNPIKPGFSFINTVDSLFCYTKISNSGPKQEIKHNWYFEEKLITSVVYNIKTSYNYRSWSKKIILSNQIGNWRVDIVDNYGTILGSREFEISALNDIY